MAMAQTNWLKKFLVFFLSNFLLSLIFRGKPVEIFCQLKTKYNIGKVCFEQDCEPIWYKRDEAVKNWCRKNDIGDIYVPKCWVEFQFKVDPWLFLLLKLSIFELKSRTITKGQKKSKWFFQADKKRTNEFYFTSTYETSGWLVFVRILEEIEDTKKTFRNYLTFKRIQILILA